MRNIRLLIFCSVIPFLMGCQTSLYSGLQEKEATVMLALLMEKGVGCEKLKSKEGWDLLVDKASIPNAVRILSQNGFPRHDYQSVGDVFGTKGLISSPQEDRIRFIFALSQEIGESIAEIDGVLSARVHLVLPENDPLNDNLKPSSASVFVKYAPNSTVRQNVTQIKHLVLNAVEGLVIEKVSVVTVPGAAADGVVVSTVDWLGMRIYRDGASKLLWIALGAVPVLLALGYFGGTFLPRYLPFRRRRAQYPVANGLGNL